jgi:hypothetical protein
MAFTHLRNQKNPTQNLMLTSSAWRWILVIAEQSGWNPMGTINQTLLHGLSFGSNDGHPNGEPGNGTYTPTTSRLVMLEDALNLMDALEKAFVAYEPNLDHAYRGIFRTEWDDWREKSRPGAGILLALADFCRFGSFWIENKT